MNDPEQVEQVKKILSAMDPKLAMIAIQQIEVEPEEVDHIKKFLANRNPKAVQVAIAEMQQEMMAVEINGIREKLARHEASVLQAAAMELGLTDIAAYCIDSIDCRGKCIQVMSVQCGQEMYVSLSGREQVINPGHLADVSRAVVAALTLARESGEF